MSIICTLIFAWILTWFDLDTILISGVNEVLGTDYSTNVYWLIAFITAILATVIEVVIKKCRKKD